MENQEKHNEEKKVVRNYHYHPILSIELFETLANLVRLSILQILKQHPNLNVGEIHKRVNESLQAARENKEFAEVLVEEIKLSVISQHLKILRDRRYVLCTKAGLHTEYWLNTHRLKEVVKYTKDFLSGIAE